MAIDSRFRWYEFGLFSHSDVGGISSGYLH